VLVEPVRDAVEIDHRDDQARREAAVDRGADRAPLGAEVGSVGAAPLALAAGRVVGLGDDMGADPVLVDSRAHRRHDRGHLVTHRHRRQAPELVVEDVEVGAADAGTDHLEQGLAGTG
jgi:hypothetical protein